MGSRLSFDVPLSNPRPRERSLELRRLFGEIPHVVARSTLILEASESRRQVILLASGWASRERLLSDGRRAIFDVYLPGDLIGVDHLCLAPAPDNVVALTDLSYLVVDANRLKECFLQDPDIALYLMQRQAEEKRECEQHVMRLARLAATERVILCLTRLCERLRLRAGGDAVDRGTTALRVPLTQQLLADYLGINIIHFNRILSALRNAGVVRTQNGTGGIVIADGERLCAMAASVGDLA